MNKKLMAVLVLIALAVSSPFLIHAEQVADPEPGSPLEQVATLIDAINDNDTRIAANEALVVTLSARAFDLETRATDLETRASALETRAVVIETQAAVIGALATALDTRAVDLDTRATALEARATILETTPPSVLSGQSGTLNTWGIGPFLLVHRADLPMALIAGKGYTATLRLQTVTQNSQGYVSAGPPIAGGNLVVSLRWRFRSYENPLNGNALGTDYVEQFVSTFTIVAGVPNDATVVFSGTVPSGVGTNLGLDNTYLADVVVFSDVGTTANGRAVLDLDLRIAP